ncbi:MAG TPA: hypothetical protein ENN80_10760 [Candidatus Hydrogenedentes bacterium]|nr:hypothetical protein [Candidatus Hydrogenedentota bacterium]
MHDHGIENRTILLIGGGSDTRLAEELVRRGLAVEVRRWIMEVLTALRNNDIGCILVDDRRLEVDLLELVLNVRDISPKVPIGVVDHSARARAYRLALERCGHVYFVPASDLAHQTASDFVAMMQADGTGASSAPLAGSGAAHAKS